MADQPTILFTAEGRDLDLKLNDGAREELAIARVGTVRIEASVSLPKGTSIAPAKSYFALSLVEGSGPPKHKWRAELINPSDSLSDTDEVEIRVYTDPSAPPLANMTPAQRESLRTRIAATYKSALPEVLDAALEPSLRT